MGLPWMYELVTPRTAPFPVMLECPLCFALVRSAKRTDHTSYHESRGEHDDG